MSNAGSRHLAGIADAMLASAYLLGGEHAQARTILEEWANPAAPIETLTQSVAAATSVEISLARGEAQVARQLVDRLLRWAELRGGSGVVPLLWHLRGQVLIALGKPADALPVLQAAHESAHQLHCRPLEWRILVDLGRAGRALGRHADARRAYAAARDIVESLAATVPERDLREEFLTRALARLPAGRPPTARRLAKSRFDGLTEREREVAALIARGFSNRQIAEALVVSERTVEAHTGHIRDKLGFTSRAEVAAWAVKKGIAGD